MIYVEKIPDGCVCGWLAMSQPDPGMQWKLVKPEPMCHFLDHHSTETYTQLGLHEQSEWEVGR